MSRFRTARLAVVAMVTTLGLAAAACAAPIPGAPPPPVNWTFRGTQVTVNESQDEARLFGLCVSLAGCRDEPYLLQVAFRVRIGQPGSAQAWVVKGEAYNDLGDGETRVLQGAEQAPVLFSGVQPLDVLDALNSNNKLDVVGVYSWAAEEDTIDSLTTGAGAIADIFENALNATLAQNVLPNGDTEALLGLIFDALFDNIGTPFSLIASNIPCLGLCDDVLGGAVHVGLGATGTLADAIEFAAADFVVPPIEIPLVEVPPDIAGGGLFTMKNTKNFTRTFTGADGTHTWSFQSGPA
jgi:hypothetical protein